MQSNRNFASLRLFSFLSLCFCGLVLAACSAAARPRFRENLQTPAVLPTRLNDGELAPLQPPDVTRGAALYAQKCVACHGINGDGNGSQAATLKAQGKIVANLISPTRRRTVKPSEWHNIISLGRIQNLMPPFNRSLDAQQRWDVQAYVWALGAKPEELSQGKQLFIQQCTRCHEAGDAKKFNDLNELAQTSLVDLSSKMASASGDVHTRLADQEAARFALAEYIRTQAYVYADPVAIRNNATVGDGQILLQASAANRPLSQLTNAPVTLRVYDGGNNGSEVFSRTQAVDPNGFTQFSQLPRKDTYFYQAELVIDGVKFFAPPQQFEISATNVLTNLIPVFETTTDASAINVAQYFYFVQEVKEEAISVVEVYVINNASTKAFVENVDGRTRSLKLTLPEDARNIRFNPPQFANRVTISGTILFYNDLLEPGTPTLDVTVLYELPYKGNAKVNRTFPYPVQQASVLLAEFNTPGTPLTITGLTNQGAQNTPQGSFVLFTPSQAIGANKPLAFEISGQPRGVALPGTDTTSVFIGLAGLAVVLGLGVWMALRVRQIRREESKPAKNPREHVLAALAALDLDYAEGKLKEDYYLRRRDELKTEWRAASNE